jgi:Tol biopolymer transport system component
MSTDRSCRPPFRIGYSRVRTNLPGSRYANATTMRAWMIDADGTGERELASDLIRTPGTWTQFVGWSPDGRTAIIGCGWESEENGRWEEEHGEFRFTAEHVLYDTHFLDLATGRLTNLTAVHRVSFYNTGVFFWPGDPTRLGFQAMIGAEMHPFSMNLDGTGKRDLSGGAAGFAYGYGASPDGARISYHRDYQVYIADADGSNAQHIDTGNPFNFCPSWSPDGEWLVFLSGEHYDCHPYLVRADGSGLRKLADRNGWRGVVPIFDIFDHHGGSSDVPVWSRDGRWVYYTAMGEATVGESVELMRVSLEGKVEQLTRTRAGSLNYHPNPSPDGEWVLFGSNRTGVRQLDVARPDGADQRPITDLGTGWAAMWGHWRPVPG